MATLSRQVTSKGVAEKHPVQTPAEQGPVFQTPAEQGPVFQTPAAQGPSTNNTGQWKLLVQDAATMLSGRNGTQDTGPV